MKIIKATAPNSLLQWHKTRNPFRIVFNFCLISLSRFIPSLSIKRFLLGLTGMKLGRNVSVAAGVWFDFFFPELISIGDNSIIGFNSTILAHEYLIEEYRIGKVVIGSNTLIGANSTVLAGISIGSNSTVSAMSLVNKSFPKDSFIGGNPAKEIKK